MDKRFTTNSDESTVGCRIYAVRFQHNNVQKFLRITRADHRALTFRGFNGSIHFMVTGNFETVTFNEGYLNLERDSKLTYPDLKEVVPELLDHILGDKNYPYEFLMAIF